MEGENKQEFEQEEAMVTKTGADNISARKVDIHQGWANVVQATQDVNIRQGAARQIRAQNITVRQGAAVTVDADTVHMVQGAAGLVRTGDAHLGPGSTSAAILADTVRIEQGGSQFILARDSADLDQMQPVSW